MIVKNSYLLPRSRILSASSALTFALALSGAAHANQSLRIALSQPIDQTDQEVGKVVVTMSNTGNETIELLKYKTPFLEAAGDLPGPLFEVRDEFGKPVAYKGAKTTFTKVTEDSYIHLLPGQAIQKTIDLSKDYQLSNGPYSISYEQDLSQSSSDESTSSLASQDDASHSRSNAVQIWVNGSLLAAKQSPLADATSRSHAVLLSGRTSEVIAVAAVEDATVTTYDQPGIYDINWPLSSDNRRLPLTLNLIGGGGGGGGGGGADEGLLVQGFAGGGGGGGGGGASRACTANFNPLGLGANPLEIEVGAGGTSGVGGAAGGKVDLSGSPGTTGGMGGASAVEFGLVDSVNSNGGGGGGGGGAGGFGVGSAGTGGSGGVGSGPFLPAASSFACSPSTTVGNTGQTGPSSGGTGGTAGQAAIPATCGSAGQGASGGARGEINSSSGAASNGGDGSKGNNGCVVLQY